MKISFNWLRELVDLPAGVSSDEVARRLTLAGLEVESIDRRGRELTGVRVAEVRGLKAHPQAEKLRIVRVSLGSAGGDQDREEDVVCGAANVPPPGGRVAWAPPGATLPGGLTLSRKAIRGVESPGMLCSEKELGMGEAASSVDGILILSTEHPLGADLAAVLGIADDVFEVNVTPNRADALSHAGIAREVAGLFGVAWKLPPLPGPRLLEADAAGPGVSVEIRDPAASPRYQATVIRGVRVGPSPIAMRVRLGSCGVRAISNLVDITNYVMLETGHPLHAFDLDKIERGIVVRRAEPGESLRTLDGVDRRLEPGDVVIADARRAVALAGVMGGADSEVTASTTNVLLEAATFDPRSVRRTAKRLGLHSEASHRFERGVDATGVPTAGARAAALIAALGEGGIAGQPVDRLVAPPEPRQIELSLATLRRIAGFEIPPDKAVAQLRGIEIPVERRGDSLLATVPTFRPDLVIEEDLVEEVMRLHGYDAAPVRLPLGGRAPDSSPERTADRARDLLAALGMNEIAGWAFVPRAALGALGVPALANGIAVANPISADYEVMRTSLLPGLLDAARRNLSRGIGELALFEVGPVVLPAAGDAHNQQSTWAAGVLIGRRAGWMKAGEPLDFSDVKRVVLQLLAGLGVAEPTFTAAPGASHLPYHPGVAAEIRRGADVLGRAGELHPAVTRRLGVEVPVFAFEISVDALETADTVVRAVTPPRFPSVTRDISFWAETAIPADAQRAAMLASGEPLLRDVAVLEDFRDPKFVPPGKKGMLWTLTYRSDERTLTDAEVDAAHGRVVAALGRAVPIEIR